MVAPRVVVLDGDTTVTTSVIVFEVNTLLDMSGVRRGKIVSE